MHIFLLFLKELFGFGLSSSSIIGEIVSLVRIFQRLSATRSFKTKFTTDTKELFTWATNLLKIFFNNVFPDTHLSDFELFSILSYCFCIFEMFFVVALASSLKNGFSITPLVAVCFAMGVGFGFIERIPENPAYKDVVIGLIVAPVAWAVLGLLCCLKSREQGALVLLYLYAVYHAYKHMDEFSFSTTQLIDAPLLGILMVLIISIPILITKPHLCQFVLIGFCVIIGLSFIINFVLLCFRKIPQGVRFFMKLCFVVNSLVLVPSCEMFVTIIESNIGPRWYICAFFAFSNLLYPIVISIGPVINNDKSIREKYKSGFGFFETVDIIHKALYALLASYDFTWVCVGIECAWTVLLLILRPSKNIGDDVLLVGESLVMIIGNTMTAIYEKNGKQFSLSICIFLLVIACLPIIVGAYCFFIFDLKHDDDFDDDDNIEDEYETCYFYFIVSMIALPIALTLYGANIPFIYGRALQRVNANKKYYD